jgi:hypothetical protein
VTAVFAIDANALADNHTTLLGNARSRVPLEETQAQRSPASPVVDTSACYAWPWDDPAYEAIVTPLAVAGMLRGLAKLMVEEKRLGRPLPAHPLTGPDPGSLTAEVCAFIVLREAEQRLSRAVLAFEQGLAPESGDGRFSNDVASPSMLDGMLNLLAEQLVERKRAGRPFPAHPFTGSDPWSYLAETCSYLVREAAEERLSRMVLALEEDLVPDPADERPFVPA